MRRSMLSKDVVKSGALCVSLGLGMALASCSSEEPTDFTPANRSGFMAACSLPVGDPRLITEVCECAFTRTVDELSYDRFEAVEEQLRENPEQPLSAEISGIIADCIIEEGEL